jgi:hypothetical protein
LMMIMTMRLMMIERNEAEEWNKIINRRVMNSRLIRCRCRCRLYKAMTEKSKWNVEIKMWNKDVFNNVL